MKRFWRLLTSLKTTAVLLVLVALLLLANVMIPQASVVGEESFARLAVRSRWHHFGLVTLGLGRMATSPVFLGALGLFFLNLTSVLIARTGATWRRTRVKPRPEAALRAWAATGEGLTGPLPQGWEIGRVVETLRDFGYQARKVGGTCVWAVKHRAAPLGFLLFHLSFFLLCAGGLSIWATRFVGTLSLTEGQEMRGEAAEYRKVLRSPPLAAPPAVAFTLESVETRFERGEPTYLGAVFRFAGGVERTARVNHPAHWGSVSLLVQQAGLAPVLWLQDERGFTVDRVALAVAPRGETPTPAPLAGGRLEVTIAPLAPGVPFPARDELPTTALEVEVRRQGDLLFRGSLRQGEAAPLGDEGRLVLEEMRYWAGLLVVSEVGGGLLIAGFLLGVTGLVWRLMAYRREVAVLWEEGTFTLLGRGEYFRERFRQEMLTMFEALREGAEGAASPADGSPSR